MPAAAHLCLYGTVLNSVDTVERSIRSVFRPDAEIVVVDGGSTDGTYEKLLEISKDYNLKIYRLPGSSRGLGRDYALRKCPEGSYAAYFDLDDEYNEYFHRSVEWGMSRGVPDPLFYLTRREYAIARGGWRDLNYAEDVEFFARIGFRFHFPLLIRQPIARPPRSSPGSLLFDSHLAASKLESARRTLRSAVDLVRGVGFSFVELLSSVRLTFVPAAIFAFAIATLKGVYRYDAALNNYDLMFKYMIGGLVDPVREINARKCDAVFSVPEVTAKKLGLGWVVGRMRSAGLETYRCRQSRAKTMIVGFGARPFSNISVSRTIQCSEL